jgi:hypothetical protein
MTYIAPDVLAGKFTCPHCAAIAHMTWEARSEDFGHYQSMGRNVIRVATCSHCGKYSLWHVDTMLFPDRGSAPPPNPDTPPNVLALYEEAARISAKSPRGGAALLRLAIQVLCRDLGEPGENLNKDIASLVKKGLPPKIQRSLDIVRVIGNNAVHPGQIDVDDAEVVGNLFTLINVIVEYMISLPGRIDSLYQELPDGPREQIEKRDGS